MNSSSSHQLLRLLRRNVSVAQIAGYIVASFLGMAILAVGVRFWSDASASADSIDAYMVVERPAGESLFGAPPAGFSQSDIAEIESQPWVSRVGAFSTADFDVAARVEGMGRSMATALFLEAVPDAFMDVLPQGWTDYQPGSGEAVPVVIPRDYLSLYNYGFAPSRGLPQVSEAMAGLVPVQLSVSGNGHQQLLRARIAGFSDRINTIAVPEAFIRWANSEFGSGNSPEATRLIIETSTPGNPEASQWIAAKGYTTSADAAAERVGSVASAGSVVVLAIGAVIVLLALFILTLSLHLLLYKNRPLLHQLMELGYLPGQIARPYALGVTAFNVAVGVAAVSAALIARPLWMAPLHAAGLPGGTHQLCIAVTAAVVAVLTAVNILTIWRMTRRAFRL